MIPFTTPLKWVPKSLTAVSLGVVLNLFFMRYPELKERLTELSGKTFQFTVEDLEADFFMEVESSGEVLIHTYSDNSPHVVMAGDAAAFLSLLFFESDPDSLFFSRGLKLSGETDTGLRFKNILDNVEIDWEREFSTTFGPFLGRRMAGILERAKQMGEWSQRQMNDGIEQILEEQGAPSKEQFADFRDEVEALAQAVQRLEPRMSRLDKRTRAKGSLSPQEDGGQ